VDWQEHQERLRQFPSDIRTAHEHCSRNRDELAQSSVCGCFHCCSTFPPAEIKDWIDPAPEIMEEMGTEGLTALCSRCGIDSVIGDRSGYPITRDFLEKMRSHWF
jgi:hypothetical protein